MDLKSIADHKGDSAVYKFTVNKNSVAQDITGWQILAEFGDATTQEIKKATANVVGGGDAQVKITDAVNGLFEVYLDKGETVNFVGAGYLEVASLVGTSKDTLHKVRIIWKDREIDWETP